MDDNFRDGLPCEGNSFGQSRVRQQTPASLFECDLSVFQYLFETILGEEITRLLVLIRIILNRCFTCSWELHYICLIYNFDCIGIKYALHTGFAEFRIVKTLGLPKAIVNPTSFA